MPTKSKGLLHIRDFPIYKRATHWNNNEKRHETRTQQIISEKIVQYEDFHLVISSLSETHVKLSGQCSCVSSPKWKTCNQNWKCYRKKDETNQRWWWNQRTECWIQTHTHTHTVAEWKPRSDRDRWTYSTILKSDYCSTSFHSRAIVVWFFFCSNKFIALSTLKFHLRREAQRPNRKLTHILRATTKFDHMK